MKPYYAFIGAALLGVAVLFQNCANNMDSIDGNELASEESANGYSLAAQASPGTLIGEIDDVSLVNEVLYVKGWACKVGSDEAVTVYGGTAQAPFGFFSFNGSYENPIVANQAGEAAIAARCQSSHGDHRYAAAINFDRARWGTSYSLAHYFVLIPRHVVGNGPTPDILSKFNIVDLVKKPVQPALPSNPPPSNSVIGSVDEAREDRGELLIRGWTCAVGHDNPIAMHFYADGAGVGTFVAAGTASVEREEAVRVGCATSSSKHGFEIRLNAEQRRQHQGKTIYIYGISPIPGGQNADLNNNGRIRIF